MLPPPELVDSSGTPMRASYNLEIGSGDTSARAYRGAGIDSQETYAWRPPITSGDSATLYDRVLAGTRARDIVRNDPHGLAGTNSLVDMLVGAGLQWAPTPNAYALGLDPRKKRDRKILSDIIRALRGEWGLFVGDPRKFNDAQRRLSFNGQMRLLARTWTTLNEATAFLTWKNMPGARYKTTLRIIDPDRLSNPMGQADTARLRGGIEFDADGVPKAYHVRNGHPADWFRFAQTLEWTRIQARTKWGRPIFIHAMEAEREDQSRGMTALAAAMVSHRMVRKHADLEIANASTNALYAAFLYSNLPVGDAGQAFTPQSMTWSDQQASQRLAYLKQNPVMLGGVRIPVLPPGDEVKINSSPRQTTAFNSFQTAFLQSIAASRGVSYEQMSMDWSKVNYSSARAALNEVWRGVQRRLSQFVDQAVLPIHYAVIEEAFDRNYIQLPKNLPSFWDMPGAYLAGNWFGPARGYVDPEKEAQAGTVRMGSFTSTLQKECADQGTFWEDNLIQAAEENEFLTSLGLTRMESSAGRIVPDPSDAAQAGRDAKTAQPEA